VETSITDTTYLLHFDTLDHYLIQCEELFCDIYIPTAFTPDGDGLNDTWKPRTEEECWGTWEVRVYNAWGQLVFFSYDIHEAWHGAASGIYTYSIYAHGFEQVTLSGHILCLK
jgi:gliding motility-associated-like protein